MLGFQLDFWDYVTFAVLFFLGVSFLAFLVFVLGLPGRIAVARKHPEAEAVNIMGWVGFLAIVPWIQAFIWAFKPTSVIDVRRFPNAEEEATEQDIARLTSKAKHKGKSDIAKDEGSESDHDRRATKGVVVGQPKGASEEGPLRAGETIGTVLGVIAKHKAISEEILLDQRHRALHPRIAVGEESDARNHARSTST